MTKNFLEYKKNGFTIIKLFNKKDIILLRKKISNDFNSKIKKLKPKLKNKNINIQNYHKLKSIKPILHKSLSRGKDRYIKLNKKLIKKILNNSQLKNLLKNAWGHNKGSIKFIYSSRKSMRKNLVGYRFARPYKKYKRDVGGVHLDLHYGGQFNSNHKALITIWIPIYGFSKKYTLALYPKSHKNYHSFKKVSLQNKYTSPVFEKNYEKNYPWFRPNLKLGESIIFHPNLLHGGSFNRGSSTRVSLDLRIFNNYL